MKSKTILFKKLREGITLPKYATLGSSGADLYSPIDFTIKSGQTLLVKLGFAMAMPHYLEAQIRPRSGNALKRSVTVLNSPGTIDSDYRDEVGVILHNLSPTEHTFSKGDRIAQMVIMPVIQGNFEEVDELDDTSRTGGFGSTGQ